MARQSHQPTRLSMHRTRILAHILSYQTNQPLHVAQQCIRVADYHHPTETKGRKYRIAKALIESSK